MNATIFFAFSLTSVFATFILQLLSFPGATSSLPKGEENTSEVNKNGKRKKWL